MQLKLKRSLKETGMLTKTVIYCLDAVAQFTQEEADAISKYKLGAQVIYSSEAAKQRGMAAVDAINQGGVGGLVKGWAHIAMAKLSLVVTVNSLVSGQHIECKDMDELLGAESAIYTACQNLRQYLDVAKTFDGRESIVDFNRTAAAA